MKHRIKVGTNWKLFFANFLETFSILAPEKTMVKFSLFAVSSLLSLLKDKFTSILL